ncbi:MAG: hypothetical protein DRG11_01045 [Epsilonproteobacteria bacterium]|nr:MAG: hypothetical protein DRG11_01045 [Campylobacterota bacterium]
MKTAIIGAGASGLICAIIASRLGKNVVLFERQDSCAKKLNTTGNGRCNLTNEKIESHQYNNKEFVKKIFDIFGLDDTIKFFKSIGLELILDKKPHRLYPKTLQAKTVSKLLSLEIKNLNIQLNYNTTITNITKEKNMFLLETSNNILYNFDKVVLSTGSMAHKLGATIGYEIASKLSHNIINTKASLVPLLSNNPLCVMLSGIKIDTKTTMLIDDKPKHIVCGDLLFTNYGLSGLAILEQSRFLRQYNTQDISIVVDIFHEFSEYELINYLKHRAKIFQNKTNKELLLGLVHEKFISIVSHNDNLSTIAKKLKNIEFKIIGTRGFKYGEVCSGGVDIKEIDTNTLQSKKVKNLYFCGELLDIDANCGGFNLQFAWSSGAIVAQSL